MIIAGPCAFIDLKEADEIWQTAEKLKPIATHFRCKLWQGGTRPETYNSGVGLSGLPLLKRINEIIPTGTEVKTPEHIAHCGPLSFLWVGARNSQNYNLLEQLAGHYKGTILIKRGMGMTIDETIGLFDICRKEFYFLPHIVERGILTFDRLPESRWSVDLKGAIRLKVERPDIFERLVVDCAHASGKKEYIPDTYRAFRAIGVQHFMFEVLAHPELAKTDRAQCLSVEELGEVVG